MTSMLQSLRARNAGKLLAVAIGIALFVPFAVYAQGQNPKKPAVIGIEELDPIKATPEQFIGRVIKGALGFVGAIALVMIVYAGVTWMLAGVRGNATDIKKAQETIFWSVIGLAVIFSSYALVHFIVNNIAP